MSKKLIKYGGAMVGFGEVWAIIKSVLRSCWTGNWQQNKEGDLLEKESAAFLGVKHGILTSSGSCAALLAMEALEIPKNKGYEVIISAVTFPTVFNIILQCGLVPVVVDAEVGTYNMKISEVEKAISKKTKAIIAIHAVGNPVDMPALMKIARRHKLKVIEDGCDTFGGSINGKMLGSFGDISITSFHAAHIVSMGVGGGVFTNDDKLAQNVRVYRDWGRQANTTDPHTCKTLPADYNPRFVYDKIGYNFQILDLQAAMGRVQLRKAKKIKELRKKNFDWLVRNLKSSDIGDWLMMPTSPEGSDVCWFALPLTYSGDRGKLVAHLEKNGIETRSLFSGNITRHSAYVDSKYRISGKLKGADMILNQSFWISLHPRLTQKDRQRILDAFNSY